MRISTLVVMGLLVPGLITFSSSARAGWFGPEGEDCVKVIHPEAKCSTTDGGSASSVKKELSGNSVIKTCGDVDYDSDCETHKKVIGTKKLFYPSETCEGTYIATYPWEVTACN